MSKSIISVNIRTEVIADLRKRAAEDDRSMSATVDRILSAELGSSKKSAPTKKPDKKLTPAEPAPDLPPELDPGAWLDFCQHRKDIKKPLTPLAAKKTAAILAKHSKHEQREMIDTTISNRWTGVFPPKGKGTRKSNMQRIRDGEL